MTEKELDWLANNAKASKSILEIGIWKGRSTKAICDNTSGHVLAVDNWKGDPNDLESYRELELGLDIEAIARANLSNHLKWSHKLSIIKGDSNKVLRALEETFDWIFIDGGHSYGVVVSDIIYSLRYLRPYGLISGHDYHLTAIRNAVTDILKEVEVYEDIWFRQG